MPCIYGKHNGRQIFIDVVIVHPQDRNQYVGPDTSFLSSPATFCALVDTGATRTMISPAVVRKMKLMPQGKMSFINIHGEEWHNYYLFHIGFAGRDVLPHQVQVPNPKPEGKWFTTHLLNAVIKGGELPPNRPFDVLLGMDVISTGRLEIDKSGDFGFTY